MRRTRRNFLTVGTAVGAVIAGAVGYEGWSYFAKRYPPTPYDDLLSYLSDREAAKEVGRAFLATNRGFTPAHAAAALRKRMGTRAISNVLQHEIAAGDIVEATHWLLPQTLVGLCALAAKT
ncbi:MAG TPA: hypothetical protein VHW69_11305 [Rhizomicrobium sp.]|jgi:hypothetical protein|nr:hypothetical protein [Rhizomicrobium sp.]